MSAWDVTGAAIAFCLSCLFWRDVYMYSTKRIADEEEHDLAKAVVYAVLATGWLAFCLARMFGAHL